MEVSPIYSTLRLVCFRRRVARSGNSDYIFAEGSFAVCALGYAVDGCADMSDNLWCLAWKYPAITVHSSVAGARTNHSNKNGKVMAIREYAVLHKVS